MNKNDPPKAPPRALGKGLHSLLPPRSSQPAAAPVPVPVAAPAPPPEPPPAATPESAGPARLPIHLVHPNPNQPRREFDPAALSELSTSIARDGVLQPLLVRKTGDNVYQIIAGERRWRAAQRAGLHDIPAIIVEASDKETLELAIIENVQRADLSPLEEAASYQRLIDEFHLTQQDVAARVGKSRVAVTNTIRILALAPAIQQSIANGEITEGHARALLGVADETLRLAIWEQVVARQLSVRQTERLAREATQPSTAATEVAPEPEAVQHERAALEQAVQRVLGTKVSLKRSQKGAGSLTIHFYSDEELEGVLDRLGVGEM